MNHHAEHFHKESAHSPLRSEYLDRKNPKIKIAVIIAIIAPSTTTAISHMREHSADWSLIVREGRREVTRGSADFEHFIS